jgi:hypothetical protein
MDLIQVKTPLSRSRNGKMPTVNGIERAAK